jgi:hypothetical protein
MGVYICIHIGYRVFTYVKLGFYFKCSRKGFLKKVILGGPVGGVYGKQKTHQAMCRVGENEKKTKTISFI